MNSSTANFESYKLNVGTHKGCTIQFVSGINGSPGTWQTWARKRNLGEGAFGTVWQEVWEDKHGDSHYRAVKVCSKAKLRAARIDYRRELCALAAFSRSNCAGYFVNLHGWWQDSDTLYLAMEYLSYGPLSAYAQLELSEAEIKEIATDILEGLEVMHREGFTHRDIKPQNILVYQKRPEFTRWRVKIADFGVSKQVKSELDTNLRSEVGTLLYTAPEILDYGMQSQDTSIYSNKVDIWSFGCVLFNIASRGSTPFTTIDLGRYIDGSVTFNPRNLPLHLSSAGVLFIQSLLQASPKQRPTAAEALYHPWLGRSSSKLQHGGSHPPPRPATQSEPQSKPPLELPLEPQPRCPKNYNSFLDSTISTSVSLDDPMSRLTIAHTDEVADRLVEEPRPSVMQNDGNENSAESRTSQNRTIGPNRRRKAETFPEANVRMSPAMKNEKGRHTPVQFAPGRTATPSISTGADPTVPDTSHPSLPDLQTWTSKNQEKLSQLPKGTTLVHLAAKQGDLVVIMHFHQESVDLNVKNYYGWTPLHFAAWHGHLKVIEWLVEHGADPHVKDTYGQTPRGLARKWGNAEVAQWLKDKEKENTVNSGNGDHKTTGNSRIVKKDNTGESSPRRLRGIFSSRSR